MSERIGVYICDCSTNISDVVDTKALAQAAASFPNVAGVVIHRLWCSEEGRGEMKKSLLENKFSRVVIAACSPKQHAVTFQKVLESAGLNPHLMQMVNIREQIAWVTKDRDAATKKAVALVRAAVRRVVLQQPLEKIEIDCNPDVVVIGAGIAGVKAALTLAQKNRKVVVVEREGWVGGKVVAYGDVFPNFECAPCMMEPVLSDFLHNDRITLLTNSELLNIKGFLGNFELQIKKKARRVDLQKCLGCNVCFDVCPVTVKNAFNGNLSDRHAVYTGYQGLLPNAPVIDHANCLRSRGENCRKCEEACPLGAIAYDEQDSVVDIKAGAIVVATGFDLYDVSTLKKFSPDDPNVLTSYQFERLLSTSGHTEGKLLTASGAAPSSLAFIHCAGSRSKEHKEYCSGICCASTLKLIHLAKEKNKDLKIYEIFSDWCLAGKGYQEMHDHCAEDGAEYIRVTDPNDIRIAPESGRLTIRHEKGSVSVDMVVLAPAVVPAAGSAALASLLELKLDKDGFFAAEHDRLLPASTAVRGIYIAGCAAGPRDIPQSVLHAQAAAGMVLNVLVPGEKLELETATAEVNEKLCGACRVCVPLCPYQAISFDEEKKVSSVNKALCKGCGVCVSSCPSGAITNKQFTNEQIFNEIEGILP